MSVDNFTLGGIDVVSPLLGGALRLPIGLWEPGSLSAHKGHFGQGSTLHPFTGSLVVGPSGTSPISIFGTGINALEGSTTQTGSLSVVGQCLVTGTEFRTFTVNNDIDGISNNLIAAESNTLTGAVSNKLVAPVNIISGTITRINGLLNLTGVGDVAIAINSKKSFDIPHPTKEGWRLSHVCVEAPTADVYFRGKLDGGKTTITLPEYWQKLVDPNTITVSLTPVGVYQELYVEKIESARSITIRNNAGGPVKCHYLVMAERIDTEKNIPEYEGTWDDYPGDNSSRSIVGKDYDRRK